MSRCALLVSGLLLAVTAPARSAPFVPDRQHFYQVCSTLSRYNLAANETDVVKAGSTLFRNSMKLGIENIFNAWEKQGDSSKERLAYVLATARRESMETFRPVREAPKCKEDEDCRERVIGQMLLKRAKPGKKPRANYALLAENGNRYYGRGYIQITTIDSYRTAAKKTGLPLVDAPDKALEEDVAALLLVRGMLEGWHGSRKPLSYYLNDQKLDWLEARNNVNPKSPNKPLTAQYAKDILSCLRSKP